MRHSDSKPDRKSVCKKPKSFRPLSSDVDFHIVNKRREVRIISTKNACTGSTSIADPRAPRCHVCSLEPKQMLCDDRSNNTLKRRMGILRVFCSSHSKNETNEKVSAEFP